MDWLEGHRALVNCLENIFTCVVDDGKMQVIKRIYRHVLLQNLSSTFKESSKEGLLVIFHQAERSYKK